MSWMSPLVRKLYLDKICFDPFHQNYCDLDRGFVALNEILLDCFVEFQFQAVAFLRFLSKFEND